MEVLKDKNSRSSPRPYDTEQHEPSFHKSTLSFQQCISDSECVAMSRTAISTHCDQGVGDSIPLTCQWPLPLIDGATTQEFQFPVTAAFESDNIAQHWNRRQTDPSPKHAVCLLSVLTSPPLDSTLLDEEICGTPPT